MQPLNHLRIMNLAFLTNGDDMLLLKRSSTKKIYPNLWSGVGGHIEPHELQDIRSSCLREIREETGIPPEHITSLELRYLMLSHAGGELWQTYIYIGETTQRDVHQTDEGTLSWVPIPEIFNRNFVPINIAALRHYQSTHPTIAHVGIADPSDPNIISTWHPLLPVPPTT